MRPISFLIAVMSVPAIAAAAEPTNVRTINLFSYGYGPNPIVLDAGKTVTLNFVNRAGKGHDFTAEKFFRTSRIVSGNVARGEVELRAGQSASVTLVPTAGRYKVHCTHPFHKMLGMQADIIVR